ARSARDRAGAAGCAVAGARPAAGTGRIRDAARSVVVRLRSTDRRPTDHARDRVDRGRGSPPTSGALRRGRLTRARPRAPADRSLRAEPDVDAGAPLLA